MSHVFRLLSAKTLLIGALATIVCLAGAALAGVYAYRGSYGINVLVRRGASLWVAVAAGPFAWRAVAQGFDVAELPVIAFGTEVDRILLARVDPARFRFVARNAPAGNMELKDWMASLGAVLVINGSYFSPHGTPATPFLSAGILSGPPHYDARHGAFVVAAGSAGIRDLAKEDWHAAFRGADEAMVSFPLLVTGDGKNRVKADWRWLANRSFVGQDGDGRIIFGTTTEAFFSLKRLANFLRTAPLGLTIALNLDGGPLACQGIVLKDFRRDFCGQWELAAYGGQLKSLTRAFGSARWALPIVLAVLPK